MTPRQPVSPCGPRPVTRRRGLPFQARIVVIALAGGLPAHLPRSCSSPNSTCGSVRRLIVVLLLGFWIGVRDRRLSRDDRTDALDSELARGASRRRLRRARSICAKGDALGDIVLESNRLGATLRSQRFEAIEASALLNKVLAEIDVAVLAFDGEEHIRLANRAAGALLKRHPDALFG